MKVETSGLFDLIENAIIDYQIVNKVNFFPHGFPMSLHIQKWIEDNYKDWEKFQKEIWVKKK